MNPASGTRPMIDVRGVVKRYGEVLAVDDLSFAVEPGETFALIGPNGAGKTTTLKMLLGLAHPDRGTLAIGPQGRSPRDARARHALGYVPQRVEFPPARTVRDVLSFFADLRGLPREATGRALWRGGMGAHPGRRASELSGGYSQRLSLAQALLGEPALLVLDEPTASLDPEATWEFRNLVESLRKEGVTIVLSSHLLSEVERVADRVLILVEGRCAALERMDDLRARQASASRLAVDVGDDTARAREALARGGVGLAALEGGRLVFEAGEDRGPRALEALRAAGIPVRGFEVLRPSLEETFLQVVRRVPAPAADEPAGERRQGAAS
jgi:ABC-type multidrug transport system ATPase subunit